MTARRTTPTSLDDPVIIEQIERYERLPSHERVGVRQQLLQQYPTLASDIDACLHGIELVSQWPEELTDAAESLDLNAPMADGSVGRLGDFQIVGEIGRGGMGVVYEAIQLSLGRRVALKVLPFAAFLDGRRLQRFKQEAQAAGILRHPNIVSVYCVGCERGVHYYAMELVDGRSLAEIIPDLQQGRQSDCVPEADSTRGEAHQRSAEHADTAPLAVLTTRPASDARAHFRSIARLGATLADALHYAHEQGVIHRDVKPSNLLIDAQSRPWVTDFGLARIREDRGLTVSGDLLGTLRYMSPEQAAGQELVDHRTDVYSLGITLYELLTLRPAFDSQNRQQLLRQLAETAPPRPRSLVPQLPQDLETIVLKAIAFRAQDRYATAAELADDLRRFLDNRPITARRPTQWGHFRLWLRRHRWIAVLGATLLLLLLVLAVCGPVMARRYANMAAAERQSRREILTMLRESLTATTEALENTPGIDEVHQRLLEDTLARYEQLLVQHATDQERLEIAESCLKLAWVSDLRFSSAAAQQLARRVIALLEPLAQQQSIGAAVRFQLSDAYLLMGNSAWKAEPIRRSLEFLQSLPASYHDDLKYAKALGWSRLFLLAVSHPQADEIEQLLAVRNNWLLWHRRYADDLECYAGCGMAAQLLSRAYRDRGAFDLATDILQQFERLAESKRQLIHESTRYRIGYASLLRDLGVSLLCQRRPREAEEYFAIAIADLEETVAGFPRCDWARYELVESLAYLGESQLSRGQVDDARTTLEKSLQVRDGSVDAAASPSTQYALMLSRHGFTLHAANRFEEAAQCFDRALAVAEQCPESGDAIVAWFLTTCPDESLRDPRRTWKPPSTLIAHSTGRVGGDWRWLNTALETGRRPRSR